MGQTERRTRQELKEDRFIEYTLKVYDFVKRNLKLVIAVIAIVLILAAAFAIYQYQKGKKESEAALAFGKALEKFNEAEESWKEPKETEASKDKFIQAKESFKKFSNEYASTSYGDKGFFYNAKCSYILGEYDNAIQNFKEVVKRYPDSLVALFSQLAIGKSFEQKDELEKAIDAYDSSNFLHFRGKLPQYGYVVAEATFRQAQCYEKLNQLDNAAKNYGIIINQFDDTLKAMVNEKSRKLLKYARVLADSLEGIDIPSAENIDDSFLAMVDYTEAIHKLKMEDDLSNNPQLSQEVRDKVQQYEERAFEFIKNIKNARRYESEGNMSSALYSYDRAIGLDFPPGRKLYEEAKLQLELINKS